MSENRSGGLEAGLAVALIGAIIMFVAHLPGSRAFLAGIFG